MREFSLDEVISLSELTARTLGFDYYFGYDQEQKIKLAEATWDYVKK